MKLIGKNPFRNNELEFHLRNLQTEKLINLLIRTVAQPLSRQVTKPIYKSKLNYNNTNKILL